MSNEQEYQRIRVIVETAERTFRGYLYRPVIDESHRLSDYLNEYTCPFLCLSDVAVNDRGHVPRDEHLPIALFDDRHHITVGVVFADDALTEGVTAALVGVDGGGGDNEGETSDGEVHGVWCLPGLSG